ncbi:MAG: hypothetical protein KatS3mg011_2158 [Acidimicrobiia bacterium]|nr:MAG: hypothetical protein KatS3mg011_2158 [Acidimicrobiia bacterium]
MDLVSLRTSRDFQRVLDEGRRVRRGALTVVAAEGVPGLTRLGLVVSRKVGKATVRNRVRRRLRHAARQANLPEGWDFVVVASPRAADAGYWELLEWLSSGAREATR